MIELIKITLYKILHYFKPNRDLILRGENYTLTIIPNFRIVDIHNGIIKLITHVGQTTTKVGIYCKVDGADYFIRLCENDFWEIKEWNRYTDEIGRGKALHTGKTIIDSGTWDDNIKQMVSYEEIIGRHDRQIIWLIVRDYIKNMDIENVLGGQYGEND